MSEIFQNENFFNGFLRFNPYFMLMNLAVLLLFTYSYIKMYKEKGRVIDYWHFISLQFFVIPVFLMYPFNASPGNIMSAGSTYFIIEPFVNFAYLITMVGYFSFLLGGSIAGSHVLRLNPARKLEVGLGNNFTVLLFSIGLVVLLMIFILFQYYSKNIFDPRAFFMEYPKYRPIYNFLLSCFKAIVIILGMLYIDKRKRSYLTVLALVCFLGFSLGTRGSVIDPICFMFFVFFIISGGKIKIWHTALFSVAVIIVIVLLGALREGSVDRIFAGIVYGNTFSDTRDFAWVLSHWNFDYVYGKTYFSGIISFIPSSMSEYREVWSISRYTNKFVGFNSFIHPGLRTGKFGEPFFNFGILGVSLMGVCLGFVLKRTSNSIDGIVESFIEGKARKIFIETIPFQLVSMFCLTSGFFEFYVLALVVICMSAIFRIIRKAGIT